MLARYQQKFAPTFTMKFFICLINIFRDFFLVSVTEFVPFVYCEVSLKGHVINNITVYAENVKT